MSSLPVDLMQEIRAALQDDSNDAEHDALVAVAQHFKIDPSIRVVRIRNFDPCWVEYGMEVEVPIEIPDGLVEQYVMDQIDNCAFVVTYGPEVKGTIDSMDNEYTIQEN